MRPILGSLGGGGAGADEDAASVASHLDRLASGARAMRALANLDVEHKRVEQRLAMVFSAVYLDFFDAYKFGGVIWSCYAGPSNVQLNFQSSKFLPHPPPSNQRLNGM